MNYFFKNTESLSAAWTLMDAPE